MKKLLSILFINFLCNALVAQDIDKSTLIDFYNKTFEDYFSERSEDPNSNQYYFQSDTNLFPNKIRYPKFEIHFITKGQEYILIKKNTIDRLYWVKIEALSNDTIDINIGGWSVEYKKSFLKKGYYYYAAWCGGDMGYIPEGRLIYNYDLTEWIFISRSEIFEKKLQNISNN